MLSRHQGGGEEVNGLYKQKPHKKIILLKYCELTAGLSKTPVLRELIYYF